MLCFIFWLVLFFLCWPLALLALVIFPLVWLICLPFRILGFGTALVLGLLAAIIFLPARLVSGSR